jgi:hypothetical protein
MSKPETTVDRATILQEFDLPTYASVGDAPAGDAVLINIDGSNSSENGVHAWTGSEYKGPVHVDTDTNTQNPGNIDLQPQDVTAIASPTTAMVRWHNGTDAGNLPAGIAEYKSGVWWVDGCVAKWQSVSATLSGGEYIFDTEVSSTSATFEIALGDTGSANVSTTKVPNDGTDNTHRIKLEQVETNVTDPAVTFTVRQVTP